jgi:hypothetical protein
MAVTAAAELMTPSACMFAMSNMRHEDDRLGHHVGPERGVLGELGLGRLRHAAPDPAHHHEAAEHQQPARASMACAMGSARPLAKMPTSRATNAMMAPSRWR